jgi:FKBP-type peptidyl-prolyl cis-trans isomerase (trigger factor)
MKKHNEHKHKYTAEIKPLPETGEVEIIGELDAEEFDLEIKNSITEIRKEISVAGFRKGQAPEKMVREKVGVSAILYEAAENALHHLLHHIFEDKKIDAVGSPNITITKLAEGSPLGFKVVVAVAPEVDFDYKKVAIKQNKEKKEEIEIPEKDIDETISRVLKARAGEGKEPEVLTDEVAKTLGEFKDTVDLRIQIKNNLFKEREFRSAEKRRLALFDALIEASKLKIPKAMTDGELERMIESFKHDVKRMGLDFPNYLKSIKKTEEEIKNEWRTDAEKKVATELILEYIAKTEKISADTAKAEEDLKELISHHPDVDPMRARAYVDGLLIREATIKFIEEITK